MSSSHEPSPAAGRVVRALLALRRELRGEPPKRPPARDFREQLAYIERDLLEMRTSVNALFFTVLTAAIGQLLARLFT